MTKLSKRDTEPATTVEPTTTSTSVDPFERLMSGWPDWMPFRPHWFGRDWTAGEMIKVDEFRENGGLVVRAELPGIDPAKDVDITVADGMLNIQAERREETVDKKAGGKGYVRREIRYGSFCRSLPMPRGVAEADVTATYKDGMLEIHIPAPVEATGKKVEITTS